VTAGENMSQYLQIPDCPLGVQELLNSCLETQSHKRPQFSAIVMKLQEIGETVLKNDKWNEVEAEEGKEIIDAGYFGW
jgi:hypothetical protein